MRWLACIKSSGRAVFSFLGPTRLRVGRVQPVCGFGGGGRFRRGCVRLTISPGELVKTQQTCPPGSGRDSRLDEGP